MKLTKEQVNEKMDQAVKQGYIFVVNADKTIMKVIIDGWDKKRRCLYMETVCGLILPLYAKEYGKKHKNDFWVWALTKEELEEK